MCRWREFLAACSSQYWLTETRSPAKLISEEEMGERKKCLKLSCYSNLIIKSSKLSVFFSPLGVIPRRGSTTKHCLLPEHKEAQIRLIFLEIRRIIFGQTSQCIIFYYTADSVSYHLYLKCSEQGALYCQYGEGRRSNHQHLQHTHTHTGFMRNLEKKNVNFSFNKTCICVWLADIAELHVSCVRRETTNCFFFVCFFDHVRMSVRWPEPSC